MKKGSLLMLTVAMVVGLMLSPYPALAGFVDFGQGTTGQTGSISWNGTNAFGSGIALGVVEISGMPLNNGTWDTSGLGQGNIYPYPIPADPNGSAVLSFDTSASWVKIVGGIPGLSIPSTTTLLSGTITSFTVTPMTGGFRFEAGGFDEKSDLLLGAIGITNPANFTFYGFTFTGAQNFDQQGTYRATSQDFKNTETVPEPGLLMMLGMGLLGVAVAARKKIMK